MAPCFELFVELVALGQPSPARPQTEVWAIGNAAPRAAAVINRTDLTVRRARPFLWQELRGIVLPLDDRYSTITVLLLSPWCQRRSWGGLLPCRRRNPAVATYSFGTLLHDQAQLGHLPRRCGARIQTRARAAAVHASVRLA